MSSRLKGIFLVFLFSVPMGLYPSVARAQVDTQLAGNALIRYPSFEYVRAFNTNAPVQVAIDPTRFPAIVGQTCDIYVVNHKTAAQWAVDPSLTDVRGAAQRVTFGGGTISVNTFTVATPGQLASSAGTTDVGRAYDVVLDCDLNGVLSPPDYIAGRSDRAGFYVVHDTTTLGPLATTFSDDTVTAGSVTPGFEAERIWYPAGIASMGKLPLIVVSHGNGHFYTWYDYIQQHLASYGYIVMSHANNTGPGIQTCSLTTLQHTDAVIGQQATLAGGVLNGHIDNTRIVWIGHSRGGEGVARAFDRITSMPPSYVPTNFTAAAIKLISSIAPTDFLGPDASNPHGANYHLIYGGADGDVGGYPGFPIADSFDVYERAEGFRDVHYLHGVGHNEFNCCGFADATGPDLIGRPAAQTIAKGYWLPLVKRYVEGNIPAKDFLWRQYASFRPIGALSTAVVDLEYKEPPSTGKFVIDDYQTQPDPHISSSGGTVTFNSGIQNLVKDLLNDNDSSFTWDPMDPMNGMTRARTNDTTRGVVFDAAGNVAPFMEWSIIPGQQDFSNKAYLSFRACQGTRHPLTTAQPPGDLSWFIMLRDGTGRTSVPIRFIAYGGGIPQPYQRTGSGIGAGWQNEFETIRIRLTDFQNSGSGVDLTNVVAVRFSWGDNTTNIFGRIGFDDLEVTTDIN